MNSQTNDQLATDKCGYLKQTRDDHMIQCYIHQKQDMDCWKDIKSSAEHVLNPEGEKKKME